MRWWSMGKSRVHATLGEGMHIVVRIKLGPDSAQIRIHPTTDSIMRWEVGPLSAHTSCRRRRLDTDCLTGGRARPPCSSRSVWSGGPKPGRKYCAASGPASSSMGATHRFHRGGLVAAVVVAHVGWSAKEAAVQDISRSGPPGRTPIAVRRLFARPGSTEQAGRSVPLTRWPSADQK